MYGVRLGETNPVPRIVLSIPILPFSFANTAQTRAHLRDIEGRIKTMGIIHEHLYGSRDFSSINLRSSAEALFEYRRHKPDIIFREIFLEGDVSSVDAAGQIREDNSVPIIFVTASTDEATLRAVDEIAGSRLLKKPYTSDNLAGIVAAL